jgi:hypothetical protein
MTKGVLRFLLTPTADIPVLALAPIATDATLFIENDAVSGRSGAIFQPFGSG